MPSALKSPPTTTAGTDSRDMGPDVPADSVPFFHTTGGDFRKRTSVTAVPLDRNYDIGGNAMTRILIFAPIAVVLLILGKSVFESFGQAPAFPVFDATLYKDKPDLT